MGLLVATGALVLTNVDPDDEVWLVGVCACTGALVLTNDPVVPDPPELVPFPVVLTGALVSINGDRDDPVPDVALDPDVGVCACTGALVLTNVAVPPDPSEPVLFPVVFTGALVSINGDRDVRVPVVPVEPVVPEPLPLFAAGADVDAVPLVPCAVGVAEPLSVPMLLRAAGDADTPFRHAPAKEGDVEDTMDIPAPASPRRDAPTTIARARLMKLLFISSTPFGWLFAFCWLSVRGVEPLHAQPERLTRREAPQVEDEQR
jgi:hypothetical protein